MRNSGSQRLLQGSKIGVNSCFDCRGLSVRWPIFGEGGCAVAFDPCSSLPFRKSQFSIGALIDIDVGIGGCRAGLPLADSLAACFEDHER